MTTPYTHHDKRSKKKKTEDTKRVKNREALDRFGKGKATVGDVASATFGADSHLGQGVKSIVKIIDDYLFGGSAKKK